MRHWRQQMQLTQHEMGELLGACADHVGAQERSMHPIPQRTFNLIALLYSIHSLPPDAPVSILQEMLVPPSLIAKRAKAQERLAARKAKKTKTLKRKRSTPRSPHRNNPSSP